jgi:hypothetical protein
MRVQILLHDTGGPGLNAAEVSLWAKPSKPDTTALGVRERMLLLCVGSGTDRQRAGVTGDTVTAL